MLECLDGLQMTVVGNFHMAGQLVAIELVTICDIYSFDKPVMKPCGSVHLLQMKKSTVSWLPTTPDLHSMQSLVILA